MTNRAIVAIIFLICFSSFSSYSFSQTITADTTLANRNYLLGDKYLNTVKYDSAIFYLEKAKTLYTKHLGEKCLKNANVLIEIGNVFWKKSMYDKALEYYFKSLQILTEILGE